MRNQVCENKTARDPIGTHALNSNLFYGYIPGCTDVVSGFGSGAVAMRLTILTPFTSS